MSRFLLFVGLAAFAAAVLLCATACVAVKDDNGATVVRFSRFADEAEVDALATRVASVEKSVVVLRTDEDTAHGVIRTDVQGWLATQSAEYARAIEAGKSAGLAAAEANAAAAAKAGADAAAASDVARFASNKADQFAATGRLQYDETIAQIRATKVGLDTVTKAVDAQSGAPSGTTEALIGAGSTLLLAGAGLLVHKNGKAKGAAKAKGEAVAKAPDAKPAPAVS